MTARRAFGAPHIETLRVHAGESRGAVAGAKGPHFEAQTTLPGAALGLIGRAARRSLAALARWHQEMQTRHALMACSDRVLADIGIEREHIPLIAKGIDPAQYQFREPALRRWWAAVRARVDAAHAARRERRRLYRELATYSDRELEEIGLRRADIPEVVRGEPVVRRAA